MKKTKKSNITVPFSWVFMLIVGAFFIILAYNIVDKYKQNEDIKYDLEVKNSLRSIFNKFGRTSGIEESQLAPIGNIFKNNEIEILCENGESILSINGRFDVNNNYLKSYPTFMTKINRKSLDMSYLVTENYRMPFKITNLMAIVSKKNFIIFDTNTQIGRDLKKKFERGAYNQLSFEGRDFNDPSSIQLEQINKDIKDMNLDSIVFVTDDSNDEIDNRINLDDIRIDAQIIKINTDNSNRGGFIYFYGKDNKNSNYSFYDYDNSLSLQTMAVFSSQEVFNCSYSMLQNTISNIYDFYILKTLDYLEQNSNGGNICSAYLQDSVTSTQLNIYYNNIVDNLNNTKKDINTNLFNNIGDLNINIEELEINHMFIEQNNCPMIY